MVNWTQVENSSGHQRQVQASLTAARKTACLNAAGKQPVISDLLNNSVINGNKSPHFLHQPHRARSRSHVLFTAALISFYARRFSIEHNSYGIVSGWLAGWVSVTLRYCIKTAKPIRKLFRPSESPITLVS